MKKLNLDSIVKILILLSFSLFFFKITINNQLSMYVNPKTIPLVIFGIITMFLIGLFLIKDSLHNKKKKLRLKNYIIFIIPLIIIFFVQSNNANSNTINNANVTDLNNTTSIDNTLNSNSNSINSTCNLYGQNNSSPIQSTTKNKKLEIKDDVITVTSNNFVFSLDNILTDSNKYIGKEIEISGFVYRDESIKDNEFIIGRYMMVCCAADIQIVGIKCENPTLQSFDNDTWVKVKGKLQKDAEEAFIYIDSIEKDSNPDNSYVYPF